MGQTSDQLRQEIDHKRDDAAAKIDQIESRVQGTAEMAKETVDQTMQSAKDTVTETVESVKQSVESFDFNQQIQERPLVALGAAVLGGFLLGGMTGGGQRHGHAGYDPGSHTSYGGMRYGPKKAGLDDTMSAMAGALMGMATERVQGIVDQSFPEFGQRLRQQMKQHQSQSESSPASTAPRPETAGSTWTSQATTPSPATTSAHTESWR